MPRNYTLTQQARADYIEIVRFIAQGSPVAARRVKAEFTKAFALIGERPNIGHMREDLTEKPLRFWSLYHYAIIYRTDRYPVVILHIASSYRDLKKLL